jgi:phosphoribosylanthranilate isomerase
VADVKFCGLMRPEDAAFAGALGARYLGVIFAGGPRRLTAQRAREVLDGCATAARRVGVFGRADAGAIAKAAAEARLDVVQLHGDPTPEDVVAVRTMTDARIWAVTRVVDTLPGVAEDLLSVADALHIDAKVSGALGGTGVAVPWDAIAAQLEAVRGSRRVVLAGGLVPENVARAIESLRPDVVDVSSGVESAPGIKDHARMRAFAAAVTGVSEER